MNEGHMTMEELEAATNPFLNVDEIENKIQDSVDENEDLSEPVDPSFEDMTEDEPEKELSAADLVRMADAKTKSPVDLAGVSRPDPVVMQTEKEHVDIEQKPTVKIIKHMALSPQEASLHCKKWADENECHFLGFSVNDGEPMFAEK